MNEKFNEGDLVEAVKGDNLVRGRIDVGADGRTYSIGDDSFRLEVFTYLHSGYTITVIEHAAPKVELPTEPGLYLDKNGEVWRLSAAGNWVPAHDPGYLAGGAPWTDKAEALANRRGDLINRVPFTRLEPRNVTAQAIISRIDTMRHLGQVGTLGEVQEILRAEFGVSS